MIIDLPVDVLITRGLSHTVTRIGVLGSLDFQIVVRELEAVSPCIFDLGAVLDEGYF